MEINNKARLSSSSKNKNKKAWYKEQADILDANHSDLRMNYHGVSEYKRMKVNYDLFNNILDLSDFEYVCKPYGAEMGELPAEMVNRDISSGKIKAMLGMEIKRPTAWTVLAVNPEATTRKEQEHFGRLREYVVSEIMRPIREKIELQKQQEAQGKELTPEEQDRIRQSIEQELQAATPEEVHKYMKREHQDPAEVMTNHLLQYLFQNCDLKRKFTNAFKHGLLSALQVVFVGELNGEPEVWNVNSRNFNCDLSPDLDFIEDGEWATCSYRMSPSQISKHFNKDLKEKDLEKIWTYWRAKNGIGVNYIDEEDLFSLDERYNDYDDASSIEVVHCVWKALRKIGFLTFFDEEGLEQEILVNEDYELNEEFGDISLEWEWIPEVYETWKIKTSDPIYVNMRPLPGQFKDLDNLYHCKLPYYGVVYDNMNSMPTSLMDRLKVYQYYYNIIMYRLELLIASDKGKKVLMNIGAIPASAGIDIEKWQYFFEATPFMWYDPQEEGNTYNDANTIAKVVDLSVVSDIQKYIEIAEYLRRQAGVSVGITDQVEGQVGPNEAVNNTRQNLIQSSHILEMYFDLHNYMKRNVLTALIETAKVAYADKPPMKLSYILDDMSMQLFTLDIGLLDSSTIGLFLHNSAKAEEIKETIRQFSHAAMQNQMAELSDVIAIAKQDSIVEAEETLKVAEDRRRNQEQQKQDNELRARADSEEKAREFIREQHEMEKELIVLKEEERRETVLAQAALTGLSFNPELDQDSDGTPDFLEIAKHGLDADIKKDKALLEREKFQHQKKVDEAKIKNDAEKVKIQKAKNQQNSVKL